MKIDKVAFDNFNVGIIKLIKLLKDEKRKAFAEGINELKYYLNQKSAMSLGLMMDVTIPEIEDIASRFKNTEISMALDSVKQQYKALRETVGDVELSNKWCN